MISAMHERMSVIDIGGLLAVTTVFILFLQVISENTDT
jgi:hypothetical protein